MRELTIHRVGPGNLVVRRDVYVACADIEETEEG